MNALAGNCASDFGFGTTCNNVCVLNLGTSTYTCNLSGAGGDSMCTVVTDIDATYDYECFGTYNGTNFCCAEDDPVNGDIDIIQILGSNYDDTLNFSYFSGGFTNLSPAVSTLSAFAYGNDGDDIIHGSNETSSYTEELWGEENADTIDGHDGDDIIYGGDGNDILRGGDGVDTIYGEADDDTIRGQVGDDALYGGPGSDRIAGGYDDDYINGGAGLDFMCGDGGTGDVIDDGDSVSDGEKLYGADSGDGVICGATSATYTRIDANSTILSGICDVSLTSRPSECPAI